MADKKIAVVRIRGTTGVKSGISDTMDMLSLYKKNTVSILPNEPTFLGMVKKVKDFATYGEVSEETIKLLMAKRKNISKNEKIMSFTLSPPVGGFERKGIKASFSEKGALGYRAEKINDLLKKMM